MRRILLILAMVALPTVAFSQDGNVTVPGFSVSESDKAQEITLSGPTSVQPAQEVTVRLHGTPTLDLSLPLVSQLEWLMGDSRMFVYLAMPGQALVPLDVRGELVFGAAGATMQPLIRFTAGDPGEYRVLVDWNWGQDQLVEFIVAVEGDQPNPPGPGPGPGPTPIHRGEPLFFLVLETADKTADQETTILTLRKHLAQTDHQYRILDPSQFSQQKWASDCQEFLKQKQVNLPALVACAQSPGTVFPSGVVCFDATSWPGRPDEALAWVKAREEEVKP